jgi:hypothetical protein
MGSCHKGIERQAPSSFLVEGRHQIPPPVQNMFHWRQQPLVTIIITIIAKRRLMCIMLLHWNVKAWWRFATC